MFCNCRARKVSYAPVFVIFLVNRNVVATTDPEFVKVYIYMQFA